MVKGHFAKFDFHFHLSAHLTKDCWWLMDAILEYTSMSRLPGVFVEEGQPAAISPALQSSSMLDLPQRMEGNRLHRFSKVLDTNIGRDHVNTKILPKCPALEVSLAEPLNRTAPSNLYKSQKLLLLDNSISGSLDLPPNFMAVKPDAAKDPMPGVVDDWLGDIMGNEAFDDADRELYLDQHLSVFSLFGIFVLICLGCYLTYRYCRHRRRQLRARIGPARKRLSQAIVMAKNVSNPTVKNNV